MSTTSQSTRKAALAQEAHGESEHSEQGRTTVDRDLLRQLGAPEATLAVGWTFTLCTVRPLSPRST